MEEALIVETFEDSPTEGKLEDMDNATLGALAFRSDAARAELRARILKEKGGQ